MKSIKNYDSAKHTDQNHISILSNEEIMELFGVTDHNSSEEIKKDEKLLNPHDYVFNDINETVAVIVYLKDNKEVWEHLCDHICRYKFIKGLTKGKYSYGYVPGTTSPYGIMKGGISMIMDIGYNLWQQIS